MQKRTGETEHSMRAVRLTGARLLELVEMDAPRGDGHDVIISVSACGICGSDLHYWETGLDMSGQPGLILGHEFCGRVVDPGSRNDLVPGDRVTALPLDPCGECTPCRTGQPNLCSRGLSRAVPGNNSPGAFAQYLRLRPDMVRRLPDSIDDIEACLIEPSSVALHVVHQAGIKPGDRVLVTGAGPIGLLCAAWAKKQGASPIAMSESNPHRRTFAGEFLDTDAVFDAGDPHLISKMKKATQGSFDIAIETSASDAGINTALAALKPRGRLVLAGINFHPQSIFTLLLVIKEIEVKAGLGYTIEEFDQAMESIADKTLRVGHLACRTIPLTDVQKSFEHLASGRSRDVKIILEVTS
ncbi:MAG TPA: zinc-binding dehydrogenase [Deltaproteobacteria bacterium]|nr:zinc-binding dehydrogenase [Deltaproteobacteria bacterium]